MTTDNVYQPTAYNSKHIPPQRPGPEKTLAQKLFSSGQSELRWCQSTPTVCTRVETDRSPSEMREEAEENPEAESFWNQKHLNMYKGNIWMHFFLVFAAAAKVTVLYLNPCFMLLLLFTYLVTSGDTPHNVILLFFDYLLYVIAPCCAFWGFFELCNHTAWVPWPLSALFRIRKIFTLNRRTGMVTLYTRSGRVRYSYPFIEFDCVLSTAPGPQGQIKHALLLAHRYSGSMHGVPLSSLIGGDEMVDEYRRLWQMIQCYMDVSQPLPDCLLLEESREKDPVTVEYDKKIKRDPRYWRDMSDGDYGRVIVSIRQQQRENPQWGEALNIFEPV
ncbi:hypothetical protein [Vibrio quintilis]|uniref:Uncharacterized protein n=1 Tax=Vibrio quintilis TaxID=1117707 RepID=A0A1M7Z2Y9_9VIBR|nr:hypothetical protein [Vibrio quintilis]SHO59329.1 hypothetical protein VQ7734_05113 [Vibrio quintilis]